MKHNYIEPNLDQALPRLLHDLINVGQEHISRNGQVKELMHTGITLTQPWQREITLPGRKANIAAQVAETMWVLAGRGDIAWLSHYLPRAADFSDDGDTWRAAYGPRMRFWNKPELGRFVEVDQLAYVVDELRADPLSRRAVISLWDPTVDTTPGKDIACNNWLSFSSRLGKLDLHVAVRSNDAMWGWSGINAFEWSAVQEVVAGLLGQEVGSLHFSTTSLHLYDRHWAKAEKIAESHTGWLHGNRDSPRLSGIRSLADFDKLVTRWFAIEARIRQNIDVTHSVDHFPEPMLRSWLRVIQWWHTGEEHYLNPLAGTRLREACRVSVQPIHLRAEAVQRSAKLINLSQSKLLREALAEVESDKVANIPAAKLPRFLDLLTEAERKAAERRRETFESLMAKAELVDTTTVSPFLVEVMQLHIDKHQAYGDSWKRRGEMLGIMANIARKVDRLGKNGGGDTATDTAVDLMVYLAKYLVWLGDHATVPPGKDSDSTDVANALLGEVERNVGNDWRGAKVSNLEDSLIKTFDALEKEVESRHPARNVTVNSMLRASYRLARQLWEADQSTTPGHRADCACNDCEQRNWNGDEYKGADHE